MLHISIQDIYQVCWKYSHQLLFELIDNIWNAFVHTISPKMNKWICNGIISNNYYYVKPHIWKQGRAFVGGSFETIYKQFRKRSNELVYKERDLGKRRWNRAGYNQRHNKQFNLRYVFRCQRSREKKIFPYSRSAMFANERVYKWINRQRYDSGILE